MSAMAKDLSHEWQLNSKIKTGLGHVTKVNIDLTNCLSKIGPHPPSPIEEIPVTATTMSNITTVAATGEMGDVMCDEGIDKIGNGVTYDEPEEYSNEVIEKEKDRENGITIERDVTSIAI